MNVGGKLVGAHRIAFELAWGVPAGALFVCHRCDNVLCCNPAHLFLGTARDNARDMHTKGRNTMSPDGRARLIASKLGKPRSAECIAKVSAALLGRSSGGKGIPHSDERRARLRAAWVIRRARDYPHLA